MNNQETVLMEILERLRSIESKQDSHDATLKSIADFQYQEATQCPFNPAQGTNGHKALSRLDSIENTINTTQAYLKGIWVGLGALGLIQLPTFVGMLQATLQK